MIFLKFKIFVIATVLALSTQVMANNNLGMYVSGKLGATGIITDNFKENNDIVLSNFNVQQNYKIKKNSTLNTFLGGFTIGYNFINQFNLPIRTEIETLFRGKHEILNHEINNENLKTQTNTILLNTNYDFYVGSLNNYINLGLGVAINKTDYTVNNSSISNTTSSFAFAVGYGLIFNINNNFSIDSSIRYINAGKAEAKNKNFNKKVDVSHIDLSVGLTYTF